MSTQTTRTLSTPATRYPESLRAPLTAEEVYTGLKIIQGGRAPGIDNLQLEFSKIFWTELNGDILHVFSESLKDLALPTREW